jgi:pyruvate,water dikinase
MTAVDELQWEKPGPGGWRHDAAHSAGPTSQILQDLFPTAMADGFRSFTGRYGILLSHLEIRYVHGYAYGSPRIAGVRPGDGPPPPAGLLKVLSRLHPEMRRRDRRARAALAGRVWEADLLRWFDELRPARVEAMLALQAVRPDELDDGALAAHVETCAAAVADGLREHFSLVGASSVPVGLHVRREQERGRTAAEAIADLAGAAERSTGAALPALRAVHEALLAAGAPAPATLDDVRAASPAAHQALEAFLAEYGQRVVGANDVTGRRLIELPDAILRSITAAGTARARLPEPGGAVDVVLADARLAVASRDDHSGICGSWPTGLLRRALLEAADRLTARGMPVGEEEIVACSLSEVAALLRGTAAAPSVDALAERAAERRRARAATPPPVLGVEHPPPDQAAFAVGLRTMAEAMAAFLGTLDAAADRRGVGVGAERHVGRAVVAVDADDAIARLQPGDVLVTAMTTPAFSCVLPIAGALVTRHGGPMSHAGIVARELGIPAVVGLDDAFDRIRDGEAVEVDPVAGTVRSLAG